MWFFLREQVQVVYSDYGLDEVRKSSHRTFIQVIIIHLFMYSSFSVSLREKLSFLLVDLFV